MVGSMLDAQAALDEFINIFAKPSAEGAAEGILDALLIAIADDDGLGGSDLGDCITNGRRLDLTDEQVIAKLSTAMRGVWQGGSITGDHSEDTFHLIGDLDKITGSVWQIHDILFASPRMQGAGIGNDGQDRFKKHLRVFHRNVRKARANNDKQFERWNANGHWISEERKEEMRQAFERLTSKEDPGSLAYKAEKKRLNGAAPVAKAAAGKSPRDELNERVEALGYIVDGYERMVKAEAILKDTANIDMSTVALAYIFKTIRMHVPQLTLSDIKRVMGKHTPHT